MEKRKEEKGRREGKKRRGRGKMREVNEEEGAENMRTEVE